MMAFMKDATDLTAVSKARSLASTGAARSIRLAAGLSLREIAADLGVSPSTVLRWERGERRPRTQAAARYGHRLEELMESS
jgi:DNA-binding transcriptional regulator YiaG